jgi:hypothetical protein
MTARQRGRHAVKGVKHAAPRARVWLWLPLGVAAVTVLVLVFIARPLPAVPPVPCLQRPPVPGVYYSGPGGTPGRDKPYACYP